MSEPAKILKFLAAISAWTTEAIRAAEAPGSSRMVTEPTTTSGPADTAGSAAASASSTGSTISVANSTASSGAGSTSFPFRARVRQEETWLAFSPCRSATSLTVAPGRNVSATIRAFTASGHCRLQRRLPPLVRSSIGASMEKLPH